MDVLMPQLGETVAEGKITKWFKSAGDAVKPGDNLFEIETDKVSMEVPSTTAGMLAEIRVGAGEVAPVGAVVAVIADGAVRRADTAAPPQARDDGDTRSAPQARRGTAPVNAIAAAHAPAMAPHALAAARRANGPLDPFFEVRTPERNFGPARLPGGAVVTPLARRLASRGGHRSRRAFAARARTAASSRATSRQRRPRPRRAALLLLAAPVRARPRSWRSTATCRSRKCRSTACARPSRRG